MVWGFPNFAITIHFNLPNVPLLHALPLKNTIVNLAAVEEKVNSSNLDCIKNKML